MRPQLLAQGSVHEHRPPPGLALGLPLDQLAANDQRRPDHMYGPATQVEAPDAKGNDLPRPQAGEGGELTSKP